MNIEDNFQPKTQSVDSKVSTKESWQGTEYQREKLKGLKEIYAEWKKMGKGES